MKRLVASLAAVLLVLSAVYAVDAPPKDFRSWTHTKSMVIPDKSHGLYGFHNVYANGEALKTLKGGGTYDNGSIFVARFYEVVDEGGMINQGALKMDVVMVKDEGAKDTAGWLYSAFGPDSKPLKIDPVKDCHSCHAEGAKAADFVFGKYVD